MLQVDFTGQCFKLPSRQFTLQHQSELFAKDQPASMEGQCQVGGPGRVIQRDGAQFAAEAFNGKLQSAGSLIFNGDRAAG